MKLLKLLLLLLLLTLGFVDPVRAACVGDCNDDGQVTVDEILIGILIALGDTEVDACVVFDENGDLAVDVSELLTGVNGALDGCPREPAWSGWSEVPGGFETDVAPAVAASSNIYLVAKSASDDQVYLNVLSEGVWQGWSGLSPDVKTDVAPAASVKPPGGVQTLPLLLVYATDRDGQVQFTRAFIADQVTPSFNLWLPIPGLQTALSPAAPADPCGILQARVFAVDGERVFFNTYVTGDEEGEFSGSWRTWDDTQASSLKSVAAVETICNGPGTFVLSLFGVGSASVPFIDDLTPPDFVGTVSDVPPEDFRTDRGVSAAFCGLSPVADNEICLFATGMPPYDDAAIYFNRLRRTDESWSGWSLIPGGLTTDEPVAAVKRDDALYVFAKPKDEQRILVNVLRP